MPWETVIRLRWEGDALPFSPGALTLIIKSGVMALLGSNTPDVLRKLTIHVEEEDCGDTRV
jgi:hypothetical protein